MTEQVIIFFQIVFIDLVLAGDNAIIIGMVASQFPVEQRKKIIIFGIGAAVVLRILFTLITAYLLQITGLRLIGGILLLYICYKLYVDVIKNNSEEIIYTGELNKITDPIELVDRIFESCPFEIAKETNLFISIDSDAISSSVMEAVSAVNHDGINPKHLLDWVNMLKEFPCKTQVLGIYEYNPVFENLSQKGARYLAGLIYTFLGQK